MREEKPFFIEKTNQNGSYSVVSRHPDYEDALTALKKIKSGLRHEIWSTAWVNTPFGCSPMAWIN